MKAMRIFLLAVLVSVTFFHTVIAQQQPLASKFDRERGGDMLKAIRDDIKNKYYDPALHGLDLDAKYAAASEKMKAATSNGQIMGIVAQLMLELNDSHTFFLPPERASRPEYGWKLSLFGDRALVTAVKPKSDAETKGLKVGDQILRIDGYTVSRDQLWVMKYYYFALRPQPGMKLSVRHPDGKEEELVVLAKLIEGKKVDNLFGLEGDVYIRELEKEDRLNRQRFVAIGDDVFVWKMPEFSLSEAAVDDIMDKASKYKSLVLDLRNNHGGAVVTLNRLVGNFFDHDIKIADWKGRKKFDPQIGKTRGSHYYKGNLIVLIDSESASAAETFARIIQLEKRGTVLGDRSAGAVMVSRQYDHESGNDTVVLYGSSVTEADLIMSDGNSLEKVGVTPDKFMIPTAADLAAGRDPVLATAVTMAGGKLDPVDAGKLFPIEWLK